MSTNGGASLRHRVLRAGGWTLAGHLITQASRLATNLVMTRLLVPEMFGVMAIATMVTLVLNMLSDIGLRQNIIQSRRGDEPDFLDTAWVVQIFRGVGLCLLAVSLSIVLGWANVAGVLPSGSAYASPVLPYVIAVNAIGAIVLGFQSTKLASAYRNFDQKRIIQIEVWGQLVGFAAMIGIGIAARSIWALVAGGLIATLVTTVLSHACLRGHRNRFRWERDSLRELISFGKWAFVSSAFTVLAMHGDRLLLAFFVDADLLGTYAIAILIIGAIEGALGRLFSAISLPALSEIARNDSGRIREVYYKLRIPGDLALLFMGGLLFAIGQVLVDILYDPRYAAAGGMLQILSLSLITARYGIAYQVYFAMGMPRYMAIIQLVRCVALFVLVPWMYHAAGIEAAIWAIALHGLAMVPFVHVFNARLGLNDFRREGMVLAALPAGYLVGAGAVAMLR